MESETEAKVSTLEKENYKLKADNKTLLDKITKLTKELNSVSQIRTTHSKERLTKDSVEEMKASHQHNMVLFSDKA